MRARTSTIASCIRAGTSRTLFRLRFQLRLVVLDEGTNLVGHRQELCPLLFIQGDREASESIHGDAALLAHLQAHTASALALERFVLGLQPLQLGLEVLISHAGIVSRRSGV